MPSGYSGSSSGISSSRSFWSPSPSATRFLAPIGVSSLDLSWDLLYSIMGEPLILGMVYSSSSSSPPELASSLLSVVGDAADYLCLASYAVLYSLLIRGSTFSGSLTQHALPDDRLVRLSLFSLASWLDLPHLRPESTPLFMQLNLCSQIAASAADGFVRLCYRLTFPFFLTFHPYALVFMII